jgi:glycerol-3-phosphate dehydrogenase
MTSISREPEATESEHYDIVVVGGGIYGAMLLLEAAQCGLRALLLERHDFGSGTSYNSLRIIHGGLRYLQTLDLARYRESVAERQWFLRTFPELVQPLPCLMPLYSKGIKRPSVLRAALGANDLFSATRNAGLDLAQRIPNGSILSPRETMRAFPGVVEPGLAGAALWYDAHVPDSQRVIIEVLRWADSLGAQALNYVEVTELITQGDSVAGVRATDHETGRSFEIQCASVINATGPSSRDFGARADRDIPALFRPSIAWNVLFDRLAPSDCALALTPDAPGAQTYFLHPWKGRLLAGTGHAPCANPLDSAAPDRLALERFIADLNSVLPGAGLTQEAIVRVYSGLLPALRDGGTELTKRAMICDHGRSGGPKGFFSVSGIKFTTARCEAQKLLRVVRGARRHSCAQRPMPTKSPSVANLSYDWMPDPNDGSWRLELATMIGQESVLHLDDLVFRRTSIGDNPTRAKKLAPEIASLFDWNEDRCRSEIQRILSGANFH